MFPFPFSFIVGLPDIPVDQIANAQAMSFDGTSYINCGPAITYNQFTLSAWISKGSLAPNYAGIFGTRNGGAAAFPYLLSLDNSNKIRLIADGTSSILSNSAINNDTWYHVVGTGDGSNLKMYINGQLQTATTSYSTPLLTATNDLMIGAQYDTDNQYQWVGKIDEVAIFNKALSGPKIKQIYDATAVVSGEVKTANLFTGGLDTSLVYWNRMGDS